MFVTDGCLTHIIGYDKRKRNTFYSKTRKITSKLFRDKITRTLKMASVSPR